MTMDSSFYQVQMSSELRAVFDELRDLTDVPNEFEPDAGQPKKYRASTLHALSKVILFQSHGRHMRWLCVLVFAAVQADRRQGYANFLWLARAGHRDGCAAYFLNALPPAPTGGGTAVTASAGSVALHFADNGGKALTLEYKFMPLLACLLDFMIRTVGLDELDGLQEQLAGDDFAQSDLDDAANALTRVLFRWINNHVTSKHEQSLFRVIGEFFEARADDSFGLEDIDDAGILDLWEFMTSPESAKSIAKPPKKYSSTYLACLRFMDVMSDSADFRNLDGALSIVPNFDDAAPGGQISADALSGADSGPFVENEDAAISDLHLNTGAGSVAYMHPELDEPEKLLLSLSESTINAVNDGHFDKTLPIICFWPQWIERLPLSYLRNEVFGSIVKVGGASWKKIFDTNAYEDVEHAIKRLETQLDDALVAVYFLRNRQDGQSGGSDRADFASARGEAVLQRRRHGFREALGGDPDSVAAFLALEESLIFCKARVSRTRDAIAQGFLSIDIFELDRRSFSQRIESINGDRS